MDTPTADIVKVEIVGTHTNMKDTATRLAIEAALGLVVTGIVTSVQLFAKKRLEARIAALEAANSED